MSRHRVIAGLASLVLGSALLTACQEQLPPEAHVQKAAAEKPSSDYDFHIRAGNAANDTESFAKSEEEFRLAEDEAGANNSRAILPRMSRALQISNQGRLDEADTIFRGLAKPVSDQHDLMLTARYELYLATHEVNRQNSGEPGGKDGSEPKKRDYTKALEHANRAEQAFAEPLKYSLLLVESYNGNVAPEATLADSVMIPNTQIAISGLATTLELKQRIAYEMKDYDSAANDYKILMTLLANSRLNPPGIAPRSTRLEGIVEAHRGGDLTGAGLELDDATGRFHKYQPSDRPIASTLFMSAIPHVGDDLDDALTRLRRGKEIATTSHVSLPENLTADYLSILQQSIEKNPENRDALSAEAFDVMQLVQGTVTAQVVSHALARLSIDDPRMRTLLKSMEDADLELRRLYFQRDSLPLDAKGAASDDQLKAIANGIAAAKAKHDDAEKQAQDALPKYKNLTSINPNAPDVQAVLASNGKEGLVDFFIGQNESFAVLIEKDKVISYRIDLDAKTAAAAVAHLRGTIEPAPVPDGEKPVYPVFDLAAAHELYATLFGPVDGEIRKLDHLVLVPNGPLSSLPLEVLVMDQTQPLKDQNYKGVPFLVTQAAVAYATSPQAMVVQRKNAKPPAGSRAYAGFGDFQRWTPRQLAASFAPERCKPDYDALIDLPLLKGTEQEIDKVNKNVFRSQPQNLILLGPAFTKDRVTKADLAQYHVIHFATHGFLPTDLGCRPEPLIVLSTPTSAANVADSFLGLNDIVALKLDADVVLLSACNTAGPAGGGTGDSLSGLASAFFFAGARGLLVTHWDLEDSAAPLLTGRTLAPTPGPVQDTAENLRQAKLAMINKVGQRGGNYVLFTHPYFWAPFVLVGDGARGATPSI